MADVSTHTLMTATRIAVVGTRAPSPRLVAAVERFFSDCLLDVVRRAARPTIISGGARGIDKFVAAHARGLGFEVVEHRPEKYLDQGDLFTPERAYEIACMRRNSDIVEDCDLLIAFPSEVSRGTWDAVTKALRARKLWAVHRG